jgi:hypothetical protein
MDRLSHFDRFRKQASDMGKSLNERADFPDSVRGGKADAVVKDIAHKLGLDESSGHLVLDIGCGCTELATALYEFCKSRGHRLILLDSEEVLSAIQGVTPGDHVVIWPGRFPECCDRLREEFGKIDRILVYSVLQYALADGNVWSFVEKAACLLPDGGRLLLGDLPNASARRRFLASPAGRQYHKAHYDRHTEPEVKFNRLDENEIDDGLVIGLLTRMRMAGFHSFIMPQPENLPMANRREDMLIVRP